MSKRPALFSSSTTFREGYKNVNFPMGMSDVRNPLTLLASSTCFKSVVLSLPDAGTLYHSSSRCSDPNRKIILSPSHDCDLSIVMNCNGSI